MGHPSILVEEYAENQNTVLYTMMATSHTHLTAAGQRHETTSKPTNRPMTMPRSRQGMRGQTKTTKPPAQPIPSHLNHFIEPPARLSLAHSIKSKVKAKREKKKAKGSSRHISNFRAMLEAFLSAAFTSKPRNVKKTSKSHRKKNGNPMFGASEGKNDETSTKQIDEKRIRHTKQPFLPGIACSISVIH